MDSLEACAKRLLDDRRRWVDAAIAALAAQDGLYAALPREELVSDITHTISRNLTLFAAALNSNEPIASSDLAEIRNSAARRAEERIPLDVVVRGYLTTTRVLYEAVAEGLDAGPEIHQSVTERLLDFLGEVVGTAAAGYLEEYQMILGEAQQRQRRLLLELLESGDPTSAADFDVEAPAAFMVLALAVGSHPDEQQPGIDAAVAARRKLRRVRATLQDHGGEGLHSSLEPDGGLALLPDEHQVVSRHVLEDLVARIAEAAGAPTTAACAHAATGDLPGAVKVAREVLELASALGRPPGLCRLDDLHFEYQLTRPGAARDALIESLDPLDQEPELIATLRAYLRSGHNRKRAALDLGVHANTIDNRLRRIHTCVGLDPTDTAHAARLHAALIVRDIAGGQSPTRST